VSIDRRLRDAGPFRDRVDVEPTDTLVGNNLEGGVEHRLTG